MFNLDLILDLKIRRNNSTGDAGFARRVYSPRWILITLFAMAQRQREESAAGRRVQNQLLYADCGTARNVNSLSSWLTPLPRVRAGLHVYVCALDP